MTRVIMAMSGGVDSSVGAALLLEQGYEVIGVTMQLWASDLPYGMELEGGCCSIGAVEDARTVANQLGIPYYVLNMAAPFRTQVIDYFVAEYLAGRTPNPCIVCNQRLKFQDLLEKAQALEAEYIATGHYVQCQYDQATGRWLLVKGLDSTKDQSYVLYGMTQKQLSHSLFPVGNYSKTEIRQKATQLGLNVANKPDSQEICFVPDQDYARFIQEYAPKKMQPGKIVDTSGRVLGKHAGIVHYTIGQRKGLGIAASEPLYVVAIDAKQHEVVVGSAEEVFASSLVAQALNWIVFESLVEKMEVEVKIRYTAKPALAMIEPLENGEILVNFCEPQRAITPGQAVVFYQGELVLGGGTIERII